MKPNMKHIASVVLGLTLAAAGSAYADDQYVALPSYRVGPYAAGGSGFTDARSYGVLGDAAWLTGIASADFMDR